MKRIKSNFHILHVLRRANPKLRRAILQSGDKQLILTIIECALNILNGNCKLSKCSRQRLGKHKEVLRRLVNKKVSLSSKRRLVVQKGGFLIPLLSAVLTGLTSLIRP